MKKSSTSSKNWIRDSIDSGVFLVDYSWWIIFGITTLPVRFIIRLNIEHPSLMLHNPVRSYTQLPRR